MCPPGNIVGLDAQRRGERARGAVADLAGGLLADADDDAGRALAQGGEVGLEPGRRPQIMCRYWKCSSAAACGSRSAAEHAPGSAPRAAGCSRWPGTCARRPSTVTRRGRWRSCPRSGRAARSRSSSSAYQRRLVRDDRVHLLGVGLGQGQRAHRARRWSRARRPDRRRGGPAAGTGRRRAAPGSSPGRGSSTGAAVDAPGVGGEHGVVDGQQVGQRREGAGVHRRADQHHERPVPAHLVVQPRVRDLQGRGGDGSVGVRSSGPPGSWRVVVHQCRLPPGAESSLVSVISPDRRWPRPRRRRGVHPPRRAAAPGAARPLLPHARLGPRRRRRPAGRAAAGVAGARRASRAAARCAPGSTRWPPAPAWTSSAAAAGGRCRSTSARPATTP